MNRSRWLVLGATSLLTFAVMSPNRFLVGDVAAGQAQEAPMFEVDPYWPKPLPNHWLLGPSVGVAVDARDNVYVIHRAQTGTTAGVRDGFTVRTEIGLAANPPSGDCCMPAPHVLVFAADGSVARHFGGPGTGYTWPKSNNRIAVDRAGNVFIGGNGEGDAAILKFGADGKYVAQLPAGGGSAIVATGVAQVGAGGVAEITLDEAANEAYVADPGNRRVVVIDINSGAIKRSFGAYGEQPNTNALPAYDASAPPARQFRGVHCAELSSDGFVYVCDRTGNRIQVFRKDGTYMKEKVILPQTRGEGSVWDLTFSRDAQQRFIYIADGMNMKVHILDRQTLEVLTSFGTGGRQPGQFFAVHSITTDSKGNIYTSETYEGKRLQKFVFKGIGPVTKKDQGVLWPVRR